ncbi:MAG: hypothetical protein KAW92_10850 [Candidatus Cloacimonetes bacterium]|nr:hypothetical protein [Candidatus Cloacimonadota bacterium]
MHAIEFRTKIKNGFIKLPEKYKEVLKHTVNVIIIEEDNRNINIIDELLESPLYIRNFIPLKREEIYARK